MRATESCAIPIPDAGVQGESADELRSIVAYELSMLRDKGRVSFAGCIALCQFACEALCVDGQHRLHEIRALLESGVADFELAVEVLACASATDVSELFRVVNGPVARFVDTTGLVDGEHRVELVEIAAPQRGSLRRSATTSPRPKPKRRSLLGCFFFTYTSTLVLYCFARSVLGSLR
jgi:hypothetical protein